jgi:hypothetical protein
LIIQSKTYTWSPTLRPFKLSPVFISFTPQTNNTWRKLIISAFHWYWGVWVLDIVFITIFALASTHPFGFSLVCEMWNQKVCPTEKTQNVSNSYVQLR